MRWAPSFSPLWIAAFFFVSCAPGNPAPPDDEPDGDTGLGTDTLLTDGDALDSDSLFTEGDEILPDTDVFVPQEEFPGEGYPSPEPNTCAFVGAHCGTVRFDNGPAISCGECTPPDTCGGGGTPNVCGHPICDEGWCWEHPYPQGDTLNDIYALDETHVWAVGDAVVLFYNGVSWERIPYQLRQGGNIRAIYAADADHVWAVATDGCLLFFRDGILSCNKGVDENGMPIYWSENRKALYAIHGTGPNDIWAAGREIVLHWNGETWTTKSELPWKVYTVQAVAPGSVWVGGEQGLLSYDHANIASTMTHVVVRDMAMLPSGEMWAVGDAGAVLHYDGNLWSTVTPPQTAVDYTMVGLLGDQRIFVADSQGTLWRRLDGEWLRQPIAAQGSLRSASGTAGRLWLAGDHGLIGSWDTKFFSVNRPRLPGTVRALFAASPFDLWAAGDRFFAHWNGTTWRFMASRRTITDLYGSAYNDIYAETANGEFLRYDGTRWSTAAPDAKTVEALKAARDPFLSRPDSETIRWCFNETECWSFSGLRFVQDTPTRKIASFEWPFEGLSSVTPDAAGPTSSCAESSGRYWATDGQRTITFDNERWYHLEFVAPFGVATAVTCENDDTYLADMSGTLWRIRDNSLEENMGFVEGSIIQLLDQSRDGTLYAMTDISTGHGILYRIENGVGVKIELPGDPPLLSFAAVTDDNIWVGGVNALYHWDGIAWTTTLPADLTDRGLPPGESEVYLTRIFALDPENIWILGVSPDGATAYVFSYDGTKWVNDARSSLSGELAFTDVWATDQQNAYLTLSTEGWIYHYKNLGATGMIDAVTAPAATPFSAITGRAGEEMRVFGHNGSILRKDF